MIKKRRVVSTKARERKKTNERYERERRAKNREREMNKRGKRTRAVGD